MLYLFWYNTFIVLYINALYSYLRQGAVMCSQFSIAIHFLNTLSPTTQFYKVKN